MLDHQYHRDLEVSVYVYVTLYLMLKTYSVLIYFIPE